MKEVLIIYYSQTGQLKDILDTIVSGLSDERITVSYLEIEPVKPYPFPWKAKEFYGVFPQTFKQISTALKPVPTKILQKKYDLVIVGYTVWFLTPSIPVNSFLKSEEAGLILKNTPVITVSATRNMWIMAQEKMKKLLVENRAKLVGNIALVDKNLNHISVITIVHWLMGGKKTKMWGIFPKPGVSDKDIKNATRFGRVIKASLVNENFSNLQDNLLETEAVKIKPSLIATDLRGNAVFSKWADFLITKEGKKKERGLVFFKYYLLFAIWIIAPIVFIVFLLTYFPRFRKIQRDKKYYASVALKQ